VAESNGKFNIVQFIADAQDGTYFIVWSVVIRTVEALGNAAFLTSSFSMVAQLFPNTVATVFALGDHLLCNPPK
jgi:hypothetical protein